MGRLSANRLMLVAPAPIIETMESLRELIGLFEPGAASWREEWQEREMPLPMPQGGRWFCVAKIGSSETVSRNMSPTPPN